MTEDASRPDEGNAAAFRCPHCMHAFRPKGPTIDRPFAPFSEDLPCGGCGRSLPAGTRMLLGGEGDFDDPNASAGSRRHHKTRELLLIAVAVAIVLLAIAILVMAGLSVMRWAVPTLRAWGLSESWFKRLFEVLVMPVLVALPPFFGSILWAMLKDFLKTASRARPTGTPSTSTWLVGSNGLRIVSRGGTPAMEAVHPPPLACLATAEPVVDEEDEQGIAVKLSATVEAPATPEAMRGLRAMRLPGRPWTPLPKPPEHGDKPDPEEVQPTLRLRIEDRPPTDAASVATSAALAACGLDPDIRDTLSGWTESSRHARGRQVRERIATAGILTAVCATLGFLAFGILLLVLGPSPWLAPTAIALPVAIAGGVTASLLDTSHLGYRMEELKTGKPLESRWIAVPGAICGVIESDDRTIAKALAVPVPTDDAMGFGLVSEGDGQGTWLTLVAGTGSPADGAHPVLEILLRLPPEAARKAGERLLDAARRRGS